MMAARGFFSGCTNKTFLLRGGTFFTGAYETFLLRKVNVCIVVCIHEKVVDTFSWFPKCNKNKILLFLE